MKQREIVGHIMHTMQQSKSANQNYRMVDIETVTPPSSTITDSRYKRMEPQRPVHESSSYKLFRISRILPIYYLLSSFVFLSCMLHQDYIINTMRLDYLPPLYEMCVLGCLAYVIVVFCCSLRILFLNIQENRDMIATSLIFLMIQRAFVLPIAVYMCIEIVW